MTGKRDLEDEKASSDPAGEEPKEEDAKEEEPKTEDAPAPATKKAKTTDGDNETKSAATKATEEINDDETKEAPVKREELSANALVIFGLHPLITKEEMNEVMSKYGKIERLETRKAFASTYCFCDYETLEEAQEAVEKLNGTSLRGKELIVKLANDNKTRAKPVSG